MLPIQAKPVSRSGQPKTSQQVGVAEGVQPQQLPPGSYQNSCSFCTFDGTTLTCGVCLTRQGSGAYRSSSINATQCGSGQLANCNGFLSCVVGGCDI
jgi:hypothetical protein